MPAAVLWMCFLPFFARTHEDEKRRKRDTGGRTQPHTRPVPVGGSAPSCSPALPSGGRRAAPGPLLCCLYSFLRWRYPFLWFQILSIDIWQPNLYTQPELSPELQFYIQLHSNLIRPKQIKWFPLESSRSQKCQFERTAVHVKNLGISLSQSISNSKENLLSFIFLKYMYLPIQSLTLCLWRQIVFNWGWFCSPAFWGIAWRYFWLLKTMGVLLESSR